MERNDILAIIQAAVPGAEVELEGADCSFTATVISPVFTGKSLVARQQSVLLAFSELLRKGELHALTVNAHTPEEWKARNAPPLVTLG